jgi:hypothetical protein
MCLDVYHIGNDKHVLCDEKEHRRKSLVVVGGTVNLEWVVRKGKVEVENLRGEQFVELKTANNTM